VLLERRRDNYHRDIRLSEEAGAALFCRGWRDGRGAGVAAKTGGLREEAELQRDDGDRADRLGTGIATPGLAQDAQRDGIGGLR